MGVQLIIGGPGCGKSNRVYLDVIERSRSSSEEFIFLVPDQATFQTQQDLLRLHPEHILHNIEICGFTRLSHHIFEENVYQPPTIMDDIAKAMLLRKAAADVSSSLAVYGKSLDKNGFIDEVKSVLSELKQYKITSEQLLELKESKKLSDVLSAKVSDIVTLMKRFDEMMGDTYTTVEELPSILAKQIAKNPKMSNRVIVLDGFTGFTPIQYDVIEQMILHAKDVIVVLNARDEKTLTKNVHQALFAMSRCIYQEIGAICDRNHIVMKDSVVLEKNPANGRFKESNSLALLEQIYGDWGRHTEPEILSLTANCKEHPDHAILCKSYSDRTKEVEGIAVAIRNLLQEGYRYRDIGILIAGDAEGYAPLFERYFDKLNLTYFVDSKRAVMENPLCQMILFLMNIEAEQYSFDSVFSYLRSGFSDFDMEEIDLLANYCMATGKRGKSAWHKTWKRKIPKIADNDEEVARIDALRTVFIAETDEILALIHNKKETVSKKLNGLRQFLSDRKVEDRLKCMRDRLEQDQVINRLSEFDQVYETILKLFDNYEGLLGEEQFSGTLFGEILKSGLEKLAVGVVPSSLDRLIIGDIKRSRLGNPKVLFLVGMNDGVYPAATRKSGIFSDQDRKAFANQQVNLAPDGKENMFIQDYYCYLAMTKPSKQLCISYVRSDHAGKATKQSYYVTRLLKQEQLKDIVKEENGDVVMKMEYMVSPEHDMRYLLEGFAGTDLEQCAKDNLWLGLYQYFVESGSMQLQNALNLMQKGFLYHYEEDQLTASTASMLYGAQSMNSVSRLEQFAECEFAHFLSYGLGLQEQTTYGYDARDLGSIYHEVIDRLFRDIAKQKLSWIDLYEQDQMRSGMVQEQVDLVIEEKDLEIFLSDEQNRAAIWRIKEILNLSMKAIAKQMKLGKFETIATEASFGPESKKRPTLAGPIEIPLDCGVTMQIRGKIDRVDVAPYGTTGKSEAVGAEHEYYINIVDYKSSQRKFDPVLLDAGIQIQLVLYMQAAKNLLLKQDPEAKIHWGGHYYMPLKPDMVSADSLAIDDEKIVDGLMKQFKLTGAVNRNLDYIYTMESDITRHSSVMKGVEITKNGISEKANIFTEKELEAFGDTSLRVAKSSGERIYGGHTLVNPYRYDGKTACDYCPYRSLCGFDLKIPGYQYRKLAKKIGETENGSEVDG